MSNDLSDCKGVHVSGSCLWGFLFCPGCTALYKHTEDRFETWQHLHLVKVQAHLDANKTRHKNRKFSEIFPKTVQNSNAIIEAAIT